MDGACEHVPPGPRRRPPAGDRDGQPLQPAGPAKATLRTRAEIQRFFDGLELLEPGLVQIHQWRPGLAAPGHHQQAAGYCGRARKA